MEAALAGILNFAGSMLASKIFKEFGSILGVKKSLDELSNLVKWIESVLREVGDKVIKDDNWLKDLKYVAYDIDDLLDEFCMEVEKHKAKSDGDKHVLVKYFYEKPNSVLFRYKLANKIKTIKKRFKAIVAKKMDFNAIINNLPKKEILMHPNQNSHLVTGEFPLLATVDEKKIIGRDHDKSKIIGELIKPNDREPISIISIIGIGGSGKTTLAKLVFNDQNEVKEHFNLRIWVYVSQDFDMTKLIGKLFEAVTLETSEHKTLQHMSNKILEKLSGKRYLLVLDDVWNEDQRKWGPFMLQLKGGAPGSRILLTTRSQRVAKLVKSMLLYNLTVLSNNDAWKLFQQSSRMTENNLGKEFEEIGNDIMMKCGGVPLAVKSLGSILSGMEGINRWRAVRDSELWDVEDRVIASLMLSYSHMPFYLQQCFLHCSIFPKGYEIKKHHLIAEWIAHGFVAPINEVEQLEDVGNSHFNSLLKISFLQDLVEDEYLGIVTCKMHDVVHDLTRYILQDKITSVPKDITKDDVPRYRYLSFTACNEKINRRLFNKVRALYVAKENFTFDRPIKKARFVRTAILENIHTTSFPAFILKLEYLGYLRMSHLQCEALPDAISCCWNLQALHITYCTRLLTLPKSIGKLKKLRTLDLSGDSKVESLPQSIGDCYNLQSLHLISCKGLKEIPDTIGKNENLRVLNLARCVKLVDLPEAIVNLKKLEVLNLERCDKLCGLPVGIGQLTCLQRLGLFVASDGKKYARISELGSLDMISGSLEIKNIMYVEGSADDEEKAYLKKKKKLQRLTLQWSTSEHEHEVHMMEQEVALLNGLEPPSGSVTLKIYNYPGRQFSNWMMNQNITTNMGGNLKQIGSLHLGFPCLTEMILYDFPNLKHLAGIVELPSLKTLQMRNMPSLESIRGGPFPSLVEFSIKNMPNLVELWTTTRSCGDGEGDQEHMSHHQQVQSSFPCLSELVAWDCPRLNVKPYLPSSLESLDLMRSNEQLLVAGGFDLVDAGGAGPVSSSTSFPLLKSLKLINMESSSRWELLRHLTALESLKISRCDGLRQLPESMKNLVSLQHLQIYKLPALELLPESLGELRSLQYLSIGGCRNLRQLPESMKNLVSLQNLQIGDLPALEVLPESLGELRSLQRLRIEDCTKLRQLPESMKNLVSLQHLQIEDLPALEFLPESLGELRSLQHLAIMFCDGLRQLPESMKNLVSLQHLQIRGLPALELLPESLGELRSLRHLRISYCWKLRQLPESMKNLVSLQHLEIWELPALELLPESLGKLRSLQYLRIWHCRKLRQLPESMKNLVSLQRLQIWRGVAGEERGRTGASSPISQRYPSDETQKLAQVLASKFCQLNLLCCRLFLLLLFSFSTYIYIS